MTYDADSVRAYFDRLGGQEWDRLESTLQGQIKYAIHSRFLSEYVRPGMHVLDAGCGPGRFAIDMARLGARLTLADISDKQLDLARDRLESAGLIDRVEAVHRVDVLDMAIFADGGFDIVVCYGAAVSYTCEHYARALRELARVTRTAGRLLVSVTSLFGALRLVGPYDADSFLSDPDRHLDWTAVLAKTGVVLSRAGSNEFHQPLALFTSDGLRGALADAGLQAEVIASANPLVPEAASIPKIHGDERASVALADLEAALCDWPGLLDAGEHLLAVCRKADSAPPGG